ncbi:hypothetical protein D3C72_2026520 [compost metagenome]
MLVPVDVLDQCNHRDGNLLRFRQGCHQQGGGGAVLRGHDGGLVAHAGVGVGHITARILGTVGHLLDADLLGCQHEHAGQTLAEKVRDSVLFQRIRKHVRHRVFFGEARFRQWTSH